MSKDNQKDVYLGAKIGKDGQFTIDSLIGIGKNGRVYKAINYQTEEIFACKILDPGRLRDGWENELVKAAKVNRCPHIVPYYDHGTYKMDTTYPSFIWVLMEYIDGSNLKQYLLENMARLNITFVEEFIRTCIEVIHALEYEKTSHGDIHPGNILIANPNQRDIDPRYRIVITDFGYGNAYNGLKKKDDYRGVYSIASDLLKKIDQSTLVPLDRIMKDKFQYFLDKVFLEQDRTEGKFARDSSELYVAFVNLRQQAEKELIEASRGAKRTDSSDYLTAENLGDNVEDWKSLFVPQFLGANKLLGKNTTILTGARGCGKTMVFRRLSAYMDKVIDQPSGVEGGDQFVGFYINCRNFIEAFPNLPDNLKPQTQEQIIHFFNLTWIDEIVKTLSIYDLENKGRYDWLDEYLKKNYHQKYESSIAGAKILPHVWSFIDNEKDACRNTDFRKEIKWPLGRPFHLDEFCESLVRNVPWVAGRPIYLFLDDYTLPTVPEAVQNVLNEVIFKRRSTLYFKISTEATNSVSLESRGKRLEVNHDFDLIDLATVSIHAEESQRMELLDRIFRPRIKRENEFRDRDYGLGDLLGSGLYGDNTELAWKIRTSKEKILYCGKGTFAGMWASDVRTMIRMFKSMISESSGTISADNCLIPNKIQNRCLRTAGGEFLNFTEGQKKPSSVESDEDDREYGRHLKAVAQAFMNISSHELKNGLLISNVPNESPRQAIRIEITDDGIISPEAMIYYDGLIRWHIFMQDWRGKSVRGMFTPRLYLNRLLIPVAGLTFSTHDNIPLSSQRFQELLIDPQKFYENWKNRNHREKSISNLAHQKNIFDFEGD